MYKKTISKLTNEESPIIIRTSDNTWIPMSESNPEYQEYLKWLSEGNTPEEAD